MRKRFSKEALRAGLSERRGTSSGFDIDALMALAVPAADGNLQPYPEISGERPDEGVQQDVPSAASGKDHQAMRSKAECAESSGNALAAKDNAFLSPLSDTSGGTSQLPETSDSNPAAGDRGRGRFSPGTKDAEARKASHRQAESEHRAAYESDEDDFLDSSELGLATRSNNYCDTSCDASQKNDTSESEGSGLEAKQGTTCCHDIGINGISLNIIRENSGAVQNGTSLHETCNDIIGDTKWEDNVVSKNKLTDTTQLNDTSEAMPGRKAPLPVCMGGDASSTSSSGKVPGSEELKNETTRDAADEACFETSPEKCIFAETPNDTTGETKKVMQFHSTGAEIVTADAPRKRGRGRPHVDRNEMMPACTLQEALTRWAMVSPNACSMYAYLLKLHDGMVRINVDPIPDRTGKLMAYATRRRCINDLSRIGAVAMHARAKGLGAFRGMVFELSPLMVQAFETFAKGTRHEINDTSNEIRNETKNEIKINGNQEAAPAGRKGGVSVARNGLGGALLENHPEYAFWRSLHLSQETIGKWRREFSISAIVMDDYLRWAAFALQDKDLENCLAPGRTPEERVFLTLRTQGGIPCPAGYKSHEERQLEARERALSRRLSLRKSLEDLERLESEETPWSRFESRTVTPE